MLMQLDIDSKTRFGRLKAAVLQAMARTGATYEIEVDLATLRQTFEMVELPAGARSVVAIGANTPGLLVSVFGKAAPETTRIIVAQSENMVGHVVCHPSGEVVAADPADLTLDPEIASAALRRLPLAGLADLVGLHQALQRDARSSPWIADESTDYVLVDLQLNLLTKARAASCLSEAYRVLRSRTGRVDVLVLLADEPLDGGSACLSIAGGLNAEWLPTEVEFLAAVEAAKLHGATLRMANSRPVAIVGGKEVRLWKLSAFKGKEGFCWDRGHAVIYRGPWSEVFDDDGHRYRRGERVAVCEKTFNLLNSGHYAGHFEPMPCYAEAAQEADVPFDCNTPAVRHPAVTKGLEPVGGGSPAACPC